MPPQIAVGDDADNAACFENCGGSAPSLAHLKHHFGQRRIRSHLRGPFRIEQVADARVQPLAQRTARVHFSKVFGFEPARVHQARGECIAHGHLCCCARRRRQVQGARFFGDRGIQDVIRLLGKVRSAVAHHADQGDRTALDEGREGFDFG